MLACAGDVVTMETVAAAQILKERLPQLRVRVVNVVDLMALHRGAKDHPHGMDETLFTRAVHRHVDVVFAFHGYPGAIHQLVHGRPDADRFHVRGFIEQGTTTTPFDMVVRNKASRYHLVMDAINNARRTAARRRRAQGLVREPARASTRRTSSSTWRTCQRCATGRWDSRADGTGGTSRTGQKSRGGTPMVPAERCRSAR